MITSTAERQELLDAAIEHVDALLALRRAKRHGAELARETQTWQTEQIDPLVDRVTRARCNFERLSGQTVVNSCAAS